MNRIVFVLTCLLCQGVLLTGRGQSILHEGGDRLQIKKIECLNSEYQETNLSLAPDGKTLFFRSDRGGMPWSRYGRTYKSSCRADGDIYCSTKQDGAWSNAVCLPQPFNTGEAQDEPEISADGRTITFQSLAGGWEYDGGPYYVAKLNGTAWSDPQGLDGGINEYFVKQMDKNKRIATDGMALTPDGQTLIFASGLNYNDNLDLFRSRKSNGTWSYPEKLSINTDMDERSVFISPDGKSLFFASDRPQGLGGLDIYKAGINGDGSIGPAVNMGEPYNSPQDDYGFILSASGEEAFFVRNGDIYEASFADTTPKPLPVEPVAVVPKDTVVKKTYKPIKEDNTFTINFDYDKCRIKEIYFKDLTALADSLRRNPHMKLEIYGSTDSRGSEEYNLDLGFKRADAVKEYLTKLGVAPDRIFTLSFGKYRPLYPEKSDTDDVNAAKNRRCEIWIKQ